MKSQKIKSQKLHVPILETNRKYLQKKTIIRYCTSHKYEWRSFEMPLNYQHVAAYLYDLQYNESFVIINDAGRRLAWLSLKLMRARI